MEFIETRAFLPERAWGSLLLIDLGAYAARLHWTDAPYRWHANLGDELFVVLDGRVRMHWRDAQSREHQRTLAAGDAVRIGEGEAHYAEPLPQARVLVIERKDSE